MPTALVLSVATTLAWAWTGGVEQIGVPLGPLGDPTVSVPVLAPPSAGEPFAAPPLIAQRPAAASPSSTSASAPATTPATSADSVVPLPASGFSATTGADPMLVPAGRRAGCHTGEDLVPTCGVLWGVAPGAHTESRGTSALTAFERKTGRHQAIFHAYHGGTRQLFPTPEEIKIAHQPGKRRILFLNWKPESVSWAKIAAGDRRTDAFIDRLAAHIKKNFPERFFFAVHHEGENDVREKAGSGYTARDYAAMYRHVIKRLRARGVDNAVSVLVHMAYIKHAQQSWFDKMYPGDDVVDWMGYDTYAYSDPGYGHGAFSQIFNRKLEGKGKRSWPGFYSWSLARHPSKPIMIAEWGVWSSRRNTKYKADFYRDLGSEIKRFPRIKAMVQFETPHNQKGQDSSVDSTKAALDAYRKLGRLPIFQVAVTP